MPEVPQDILALLNILGLELRSVSCFVVVEMSTCVQGGSWMASKRLSWVKTPFCAPRKQLWLVFHYAAACPIGSPNPGRCV